MGEPSACLVRSFSSPADTRYEGNPVRSLGESISFGRFMNENLDWEKWSTFTQNRYVEEAERYSKPGSVAAKKAYFEAHYKRKAAERAAALVQEANANHQANGTSELEAQQRNYGDSSSETSSNVQNVVAANEQPDEETVNYQVGECADRDQRKCDAGQSDLDISNVEGVVDVSHPHVHTNINLGSFTSIDDSNQFDHVEDNTNTGPVEEKMLDHSAAGPEVLALPFAEREANSSPILSTKTVSSNCSRHDEKNAAATVPSRSGINRGPKGKKSVGDFVEKNKLTAQSLHMSINLPSGTGETRKRAAVSTQSRNGVNNFSTNKKSVGGLVEKKRIDAPLLKMSINLPSGAGMPSNTATKPRNGTNFVSKIMKSVGNSVAKRPTTRSLHMSINLPSGAAEPSKSASVFEKNRIKKVHSNLPKNNPVVLGASTEVSRGLLDQGSANLPSQRRTERLLNKSVSGDVTVNAQPSSSISFGCPKSSSTKKSNFQSATISLPFKFRSEERAVKRREFLQRMDETKSKEEEKVKLQRTLKGKTELDHKKLGQSNGSISKLNEDKLGGSHSPSNQIRKTSLTLPRSPKLMRKAHSSSSTVQDKSLGNSWKSRISSTNNSKRTTEKINRTTRPLNSLSSTTGENASPNIQH
ncbi:hypothetical protein PHAVU_001G258100 [Phaseolus vulgaris]|uniref:Uncharacterized protein n=1 Tax=Phaseolus vulgaris TaxID=3885 RepID=V7D2H6_PHAVU|nr:hypothetical protein PHAVU_001G258100g [Phaseolus vulgaris]ESW35710.1 hypothetical protein PHAVU_001G258100g [Phaseolus vulgaris]